MRAGKDQTSYEIWHGKKPNITYFKVLDPNVISLETENSWVNLTKKSDEGIFIGNSANNCAYRVLNVRTCAIQESINVVIDDHTNDSSYKVNKDDDGVEMNVVEQPTSKSKQP